MKNKNSFSIDNFINNKELNIMKAVLPILPPHFQKFMAMYIAINELSNIFALFKALGSNNFNTSQSDYNLDISKILEAVKRHLDPSEVEMFENYYNMINMMNMFNEMSSMFESDESDDCDENHAHKMSGGFNMDMLKGMLTPEQSAIFDSLSNMN